MIIPYSIQCNHTMLYLFFSHIAKEEGFLKLWEGLPPALVRHVSKCCVSSQKSLSKPTFTFYLLTVLLFQKLFNLKFRRPIFSFSLLAKRRFKQIGRNFVKN